MNISLWTGGV